MFTPGPWEVDFVQSSNERDPLQGNVRAFIDGVQHTIAVVCGEDDAGQNFDDALVKANSQVIAAAPDLLYACNLFEGWYTSDAKSPVQLIIAADAIIAAIAKATGQPVAS